MKMPIWKPVLQLKNKKKTVSHQVLLQIPPRSPCWHILVACIKLLRATLNRHNLYKWKHLQNPYRTVANGIWWQCSGENKQIFTRRIWPSRGCSPSQHCFSVFIISVRKFSYQKLEVFQTMIGKCDMLWYFAWKK